MSPADWVWVSIATPVAAVIIVGLIRGYSITVKVRKERAEREKEPQ